MGWDGMELRLKKGGLMQRFVLEQGPARGVYQGTVSKPLDLFSEENNQTKPLWKRFLLGTVWVVFVLGLISGAFVLDDSVVAFVRENSNGTGRWLAGRVSYWGDWYGVFAIGVAIWWVGKKRGSSEIKRLALLMGLCAAISGLGANGVRAVTGRARPFSEAAPGWYGPAKGLRVWAKGARDFQSFPSAHTAVVAGFFAPLVLRARRRKGRGLALLGSLGVGVMGWARVWVGAHHLSDVTAAAVLGLTVGWLVLRKDEALRSFAFFA